MIPVAAAATVPNPVQPKMEPCVKASLQMLLDPTYSDLKITNSTYSREWHVHRGILSPRCEFFKACLRNSCKEAEANSIDLPEDDPDHIDYLLRYLYTLDVEVAGMILHGLEVEDQGRDGWSRDRKSKIWTHSDHDAFALFVLADRLGLHAMKHKWQEILVKKANNLDLKIQFGRDNVPTEDSESEKMKSLGSFLEATYACKNPGIEEVRTAALKVITSSVERSATSQQVMLLETLVKKEEDFGLDLIRAMAKQNRNQPVVDLMNYKSVLKTLRADAEARVQLVKSLVSPRSY